MGRLKKTDLEGMEDVKETSLDEFLKDFGDDVEIVGKVYRKTSLEDSVGRTSFEAICKVNELIDEDWIGKHFGGGNYFVKWTFSDGTNKVIKQKNYYVGHEYDKFVKKDIEQTKSKNETLGGLDLGGLLGSLTVDKMAAIGGAVKVIKEIFAPPPPPPQIDVTKLLEIMVANNQKNTPSDAIVTACLTSLQKPQQPQTSISQQIADFNALKEIFNDNSNNSEGGEMNFLLEKAIEYLPLMLQKKNNDFRAVGAEVRENPLVNSIITSNPELTQKFFETARAQYGDEAVKQLARGFGYEATIVEAQKNEVTNEPKEN